MNVIDIADYLYDQRSTVVGSTYFQKLSTLINDVKKLQADVQSGQVASNVGQHLDAVTDFLRQKYQQLHQLLGVVEELERQLTALYRQFLEDNPALQKGAQTWSSFLGALKWSYSYLQVNGNVLDLVAYVRRRVPAVAQQSATDAYMRLLERKTTLRLRPEWGSIELEQKLPFSWLSFDESPRLNQLAEMRQLNALVAMFQPSNVTLIDRIYSYVPNSNVGDWIPPFKGSAHLIGLQHFLTFNGRYYEFAGPCTYLLARDMLTDHFTLAVHYLDTRGKPYASVLQLVVDQVQWELDLSNQTIRVGAIEQVLPFQHGGTRAYYHQGMFTIHSPAKGLLLECIAAYEVCTLTLSGNGRSSFTTL